MRGNLAGGVTSSCHAEPGDLHPAGFMVWLPADVRICRIADVAHPYIYALTCMPPTLVAIVD
jgi:hypothetical protein